MTRNHVQIALFLVAVLFLSTIVPGIVAGQNSVTMTVTVVDQNGDPISNVDISANWEGGGPVNETTRSNGQALVDVSEGANVTISVHDNNYVRNAPLELTNVSSGEVEVSVSKSGSATIDVVGEQGSVEGAIVQFYQDDTRVVNERAGSDGQLTTRDIEQGDYEVRVWQEGYLRNTTELTVDGDVSRQIQIRQDSRLLGIHVTDDHFSPARPVANASITIKGVGTVSTLSNGETTIQVPVNTDYKISVTKDDYKTNSTTVRVREAAKNANLTIQRTDAITLKPGNERVVVGESVRVTVTDEYGDPVEDADIAIEGESAGQTNGQGVATVSIESAGTHNLVATSGDLEANATVDGIPADGGEATATTGEPTATTTDSSGPGFTVVSALVAIVGLGLLTRRE